MIHKSVIFLFVAVITLFISCKKDEIVHVDLGHDYFPMQTGFSQIYMVDSLAYNGFTLDTITYKSWLKISYDSVFIDNEQDTVYKTILYTKKIESDPWKIKEIRVTKFLPQRIEQVENNTRYIKLIFPIKENGTWNINAYNTLEEYEVKYDNVHRAFSLDSLYSDSSISIVKEDAEFIVDIKSTLEVYGKNEGLIYFEKKDIDVQEKDGYELIMRLIKTEQ